MKNITLLLLTVILLPIILFTTCTEDPASSDISGDLKPKGTITGYVYNMWGNPIKDVLVSISADSAVPGVSKETGLFTVGKVMAGTHVLHFSHIDYEDDSTYSVTIAQGVDDTLSDTVYLSYKYFILKGKVVSNGQPVDFAGVVIDNLLLSTLTNTDGYYLFDKVRKEDEFKLIYAKSDIGWYDLTGIKGVDDDTTYIPDVTLFYKGAIVSGTVYDTLNNPAANVRVFTIGGGLVDTSDVQGEYILNNVPFNAKNIPIYAYTTGLIGATSGINIDTNTLITGIDIYLRKVSDFVNGIKLEVSDIIVEDTATSVEMHVLALTDGTVSITDFEWFFKNMAQPVATTQVPYVTIPLKKLRTLITGDSFAITDTTFKAAVRAKTNTGVYSEQKEFFIKIVGTDPRINASVACHPDSTWKDTATITASQNAYFHCAAIVMFGGIDTLEWDFGDNTPKLIWKDSLPVFGHRYTASGTYTAKCRVKSTYGNEAKDSVVVIVNPSAIDTPVYINPLNGDTLWSDNDSVTLLWHAVAGNNMTYNVYLDSLNTIPVVKVASLITDTSYTVLTGKDIVYYWAIEAVSGTNSAMGSPYSFIRKEIVTNNAPQFTSQPQDMTDTAKVGSEYIDTVHATDIDGDVIGFTKLAGPPALQVVDSIVTWTPTINDTGLQPVSVRASDGKGGLDTLKWTITVKDTGGSVSSNAYLSNLILSQGALTPPFDTGTTVYTSWVNNTIASITVTPTALDSMAVIMANNDTVQSGNASDPISLQVGENPITIIVTAEDKVTEKTYTVTVTREIDVTVLNGLYVTDNDTIKKENSPYFVTSGILVAYGGTLLIEPGVKLLMDSAIAIDLQGTLIARGTVSDSIVFSAYTSTKQWGYLQFSDSATDATFDTDTNYTGGCILEYCVVEFAGSSSKYGALCIDYSSPYINCSSVRMNIKSGVYGSQSGSRIENCEIRSNTEKNHHGGGIYNFYGNLTIKNCTITGNNTENWGGGIYQNRGTAKIFYTLISDNEASNYSACYYWSDDNMAYNTINKNRCTASSRNTYTLYIKGNTSVVHNNILTNIANYELENGEEYGSPNLDATNNYWGTTDENEIKNKIYDWFDDDTKGIVDYSPWLTEPDPDAPPIPPR